MLALGAALAAATGTTIRTRRKILFGLLPVFAAALMVMTILETSAHLSVSPGPALQADFGAWIGGGLAVLVLISAAVAAIFGIPNRFRQPG